MLEAFEDKPWWRSQRGQYAFIEKVLGVLLVSKDENDLIKAVYVMDDIHHRKNWQTYFRDSVAYNRWIGRIYGGVILDTRTLLGHCKFENSIENIQAVKDGIRDARRRIGKTAPTDAALFLLGRKELDTFAPRARITFPYLLYASSAKPHFDVSCGCQQNLSPSRMVQYWTSTASSDPKHRMETMVPVLIEDLMAVRDEPKMALCTRRAAQTELSQIFCRLSEQGVLIGPPRSAAEMANRDHLFSKLEDFQRPNGSVHIPSAGRRVY